MTTDLGIPPFATRAQPRAARLHAPTFFQPSSASSRNPGAHRESSAKLTGLHFPDCSGPPSCRTSSSSRFPQRLFCGLHDSCLLRFPSCHTSRRALRQPYTHFRSVTYFRFAGRAVDGLNRTSRISPGFRCSRAQHGFLTNLVHGTNLSLFWQGARRELGGCPCGLGPLGNGLRRWRTGVDGCETRSCLSGAAFS